MLNINNVRITRAGLLGCHLILVKICKTDKKRKKNFTRGTDMMRLILRSHMKVCKICLKTHLMNILRKIILQNKIFFCFLLMADENILCKHSKHIVDLNFIVADS